MALERVMVVYRELERTGDAKEKAKEYLERYPKGTFAEIAKRIAKR